MTQAQAQNLQLLRRSQLQSLHDAAGSPCISIYQPTFRKGPETQQNPIRFKNLLTEARRQLLASDHPEADADTLLETLAEHIDGFDFWQHQSDGLAVFASPDLIRSFRLPLSFEELVSVGDRFHLTPLLPALTADGRFYILALSQKRVRLLEARRDSARALDLHDIPESLRDAVGYDWEQRSLQFTSGTSGVQASGGRRRAMFHGHGAGSDDRQAELRRFLQQIDHGIRSLVDDPATPLVVAAVDHVFAMFRSLSDQNVVEEGILGNPDELSDDELHRRAWKLMEPEFRAAEDDVADHFRELRGSDRASDQLDEVVPAGVAGRIDSLLVARDRHCWGRYDPSTRDIVVVGESRADTEDLVDRAAMECLFHGGSVYAVPGERLPSDEPVAAVYRY